MEDNLKEIKDKRKEWLENHPVAMRIAEYAYLILMSTLSAMIFAFGFKTFMNPGNGYPTIVAGGASGISQVIVLICKVCGWETINESLAISILYFVVNAPLLVLAFFGVGKRFAIFTLINVAEASLFVDLFDVEKIELFAKIAEFVNNNGALLARVLFASLCTGLSSAITFVADISAGGTDIVSYYIGMKKKRPVGMYGLIVNGTTLFAFTLMDIIHFVKLGGPDVSNNIAMAVGKVFFTILYLVLAMIIIDSINRKNQKIKVEVVSSVESIGKQIVALIPHAATLVEGQGVYSGMKKYVLTIVVSRYELKLLLKALQEIDPQAFITVIHLSSVLGRFHTKQVK
ncbi:MAG: YitT family protein [Bacilli bacterium]|nr:YitT family protein [Bacilli bacterium]